MTKVRQGIKFVRKNQKKNSKKHPKVKNFYFRSNFGKQEKEVLLEAC